MKICYQEFEEDSIYLLVNEKWDSVAQSGGKSLETRYTCNLGVSDIHISTCDLGALPRSIFKSQSIYDGALFAKIVTRFYIRNKSLS